MSRICPNAEDAGPAGSRKATRFALSGALAAGLLAAAVGSVQIASAADKPAVSAKKLTRAMTDAEKAVLRSPQDVALRTALAQAYLEGGRFRSAATAYGDAIALGDTTARTQLSLVLAHIGAGNATAAVALLDAARDTIPATDRGLALALAGETGRGLAILTDALRGGENTAKLRQNLAYAFALEGRWAEARVMMAQDVPADQIDNRIGEWAMMARPEDTQKRVAALLGAPVAAEDPGRPERLALADAAPSAQLVAATITTAVPAPQTAAAELPALDQAPAAQAAELETRPVTAVAPAPAPVPVVADAPRPAPPSFAMAFAPAPVRAAKTRAPRTEAQRSASAVAAMPVPRGSHRVQLGSFSSQASAQRAWRIFTARNPELRRYRMTITQASAGGKSVWRVAVGGFNQVAAVQACTGVKHRGGACFAYAASVTPARATLELALAGPGKARGR